MRVIVIVSPVSMEVFPIAPPTTTRLVVVAGHVVEEIIILFELHTTEVIVVVGKESRDLVPSLVRLFLAIVAEDSIRHFVTRSAMMMILRAGTDST